MLRLPVPFCVTPVPSCCVCLSQFHLHAQRSCCCSQPYHSSLFKFHKSSLTQELQWTRDTSTPHRSETYVIAERAKRKDSSDVGTEWLHHRVVSALCVSHSCRELVSVFGHGGTCAVVTHRPVALCPIPSQRVDCRLAHPPPVPRSLPGWTTTGLPETLLSSRCHFAVHGPCASLRQGLSGHWPPVALCVRSAFFGVVVGVRHDFLEPCLSSSSNFKHRVGHDLFSVMPTLFLLLASHVWGSSRRRDPSGGGAESSMLRLLFPPVSPLYT